MSDDDSSSNDSDYDPTHDDREEDKEHGATLGREGNTSIAEISYSRKRKADALWDEMNLQDKLYTQQRMEKSLIRSQSSKPKPVKVSKAKMILEGIFGRSEAANLIHVADFNNDKSIDDAELKNRVRKSVQSLAKRQTVTETRKFAGQNIMIQRSLKTGQSSSIAKPADSLDKALETIKGPKAVNTVVKSSMDWDNFKEKEGLEDELLAAQKEGYLTRKDFLDRVDYRKFEIERDERMRARATNMSISGSGGTDAL